MRVTKLQFTLLALFALGVTPQAGAAPFVQCPGDLNGDADWDDPGEVQPPGVRCIHLAAADGFINMGDDQHKLQYTFGFSDQSSKSEDQAMSDGIVAANFSAPTIHVKEGEELYLTLTNAGFLLRPDLADPHSVHYHGFSNAGDIFDGLPEASITINTGASFTYYYNNVEPGTYMYHCHVEAPEHMQMGMLGNLYVEPAQDGTPIGGYTKFAYNDGDGSTGYDVFKAIQLSSFDPVFHDLHLGVQPLPFANMKDTYPMMNGRGYPDTVDTGPKAEFGGANGIVGPAQEMNFNENSQPIDALITAAVGDRILLRLSNLSVTNFFTITALGLPMRVVGTGARILRGPDGAELYYDTSSVTIGGGEAVDVLIDAGAPGVTAGTYYLYTTNLNYLSNDVEDYGGMMTEIRVSAP